MYHVLPRWWGEREEADVPEAVVDRERAGLVENSVFIAWWSVFLESRAAKG